MRLGFKINGGRYYSHSPKWMSDDRFAIIGEAVNPLITSKDLHRYRSDSWCEARTVATFEPSHHSSFFSVP
ncbi:hypothetical protein PILCRDRAFT_822573 [Piloderma croceum F 1598]|nr:hypothetical protein PILCRDRAFT_822573 [Piloderma croceum F 1598]